MDLKITCHGEELDDKGKCKTCGRVYDFTIKVTEPVLKEVTDWGKIIAQAIFKTSLVIALMFILYFILIYQK